MLPIEYTGQWSGLHMTGNNEINLFRFERFQDFLGTYYSLNKKTAGSFTLDRWAERIGYQSPRTLAMVIKGQRAPSLDMGEKLATYFNLRGTRKHYFELLHKKAVLEFKGENTDHLDHQLKKCNPELGSAETVDVLSFEYFYEWYNLSLKQLVSLPDFRESARWISARLKRKVSPAKVRKSLELLQKLGLLVRDKTTGRLKARTDVSIGQEVPSIAIKKHHDQMLQRAREALFEDDLDRRHFSAATLCIKKNDLATAKNVIEDFLDEFDQRFTDTNNGEEVYQIGVQFFSHTREVKGEEKGESQ